MEESLASGGPENYLELLLYDCMVSQINNKPGESPKDLTRSYRLDIVRTASIINKILVEADPRL